VRGARARIEAAALALALATWPREARAEVEAGIRATVADRRSEGAGFGGVLLESVDIAWAGVRARWNSVGRHPARTDRREGTMGEIGTVLRHAARGLRRSPRWALMVGGVLGVGIAASASVFAVVDAVAIRPLPYPDAEALVRIGATREGRLGLSTLSGPNFTDLVDDASQFAALTAFSPSTMSVAVQGRTAELRRGGWVSGRFFDVLGVPPRDGRTLASGDDRADAPLTAVVSSRLAAQLFGEADAVGRSLEIDGRAASVVGVMPPDFQPPEGATLGGTELWAPLAHAPLPVEQRGLAFLDAIGRLAAGATLESAGAEMAAGGRGLIEAHGLSPRAFTGVEIRPLRAETVGETGPLLTLLLTAVGLVLGIAALNAANLVLLRVLDRADSLRVQIALGASRRRVAAESATQGGLVAVLGGVAGTALAFLAVQAVATARPVQLARLGEAAVNGRVIVVALGAALVVGVLAGLVPALVALRRPGLGSARSGARVTGRGSRLMRDGVVLAQVALGLALAGSAVLVARSLASLRNVPIGFEVEDLHVATLRIDGIGGESFDERLLDALEDAAAAHPGVVASGLGSGSPYVPGGFVGYLDPEGVDISDEQRMRGRVEFHRASGGALGLIGVPLLQGRDLADSDRADSEPVVVVSESVARAWWQGQDPLGRYVVLGGDGSFTPRRVVGVAATPRYRGPGVDPEEHVWIPWRQMPAAPMDLRVRTRAGFVPSQLFSAVVDEVVGVEVRGVRTVDEELSRRFVEPAFFTLVFGFFAGTATLFAGVGLFSTLAFAVRSRRAELGVRLALGAGRARIARAVLLRGMTVAALGVLCGLGLAAVGARLTAALLFGVEPGDALAWSGAATLMLLTALVACGVPAWRAGRTQPVDVLRAE